MGLVNDGGWKNGPVSKSGTGRDWAIYPDGVDLLLISKLMEIYIKFTKKVVKTQMNDPASERMGSLAGIFI